MLILCRGLVLGLLALTASGQNTTTDDGSSTTTSISITTTSISSSTTTTDISSTTSLTSSTTTSLITTTSSVTSLPPTTSSSSINTSTSIPTTTSSVTSASTTRQITTSSSMSSLIPSPSSTQTTPKATSTSLSQSRTKESAAPTTYTYSSVSSSVSSKQSSIQTSTVIPFTSADGTTGFRTVSTVIVTEVPATTYLSTGLVTSTSKPTGVTGLLDGSGSSSSGNLSSGAKAGIGAGVGGGVLIAAIFGAWYGMRRRKRSPRIDDSDRYTPSIGNSMIGFGGGGKNFVGYTTSEVTSPRQPEADPLARYARPGSDRPTQAPTSVSSGGLPRRPTVGASASGGYHSRFNELSEAQEQVQYAQPVHKSTSSQSSEDQFYSRPLHQRTGSLENRYGMPGPTGNGFQQVPELDERNTDTLGNQNQRTQLIKQPPMQQGRFDPSQNF